MIQQRTARVVYDPDAIVRRRGNGGCGCHEPVGAGIRAREVAEQVRPHSVPGAMPLNPPGEPRCRPFLTAQKDMERFAACNALAESIGPLNDPKKAFRYIQELIGGEVNEVFGLVTLNLHLLHVGSWETGRGEASSVAAPMVPTLQAALIDGAHAVILFHVHPSGVEAKPSQADKDTTKAFVKAFDIVNIDLMDHIICGGDVERPSYYSFAEDGAL